MNQNTGDDGDGDDKEEPTNPLAMTSFGLEKWLMNNDKSDKIDSSRPFCTAQTFS